MQVQVTFRNMKSSDALREYAEERCERLKKFLFSPIDVTVVMSKHKYRNQAEVKVAANGMVMKSENDSEDMYASLDAAMEKIERQARKYKDKIRDFKPVSLGAEVMVRHDILESEASEEETGPRIVNSQEFSAKPMSVDEAIMQMDLINSDFLVFVNANTQVVNVIYRRSDGNIGLIDADTRRPGN